MEPHQTYKLCVAKETTNKVERQPMEQEKVFANDVTDRP